MNRLIVKNPPARNETARNGRAAQPAPPETPAPAPVPLRGSVEVDGYVILNLYCREIGAFARLSLEEETALAAQIRQGDAAARERMIKANLRLVVKIARSFENLGLPLLDLISEGNIGLMKAVGKFDPAKGAKFSTYAAFYIKQAIRLALCNQARTIRVPVHVHEKLQSLHSASSRLHHTLGRAPTSDEVAAETGLPAARVARMHRALQGTVSLDETPEDRARGSVAETVADESSLTPDEQLARATTREQLQQLLSRLTAREQAVLRLRFGLEDDEVLTLDEVGRQLQLSSERVRQVQNEALARLRQFYKNHKEIPAAA